MARTLHTTHAAYRTEKSERVFRLSAVATGGWPACTALLAYTSALSNTGANYLTKENFDGGT